MNAQKRRSTQNFGRCDGCHLGFTSAAGVAALFDDAGEHVVSQLQPAHALAVIDAQELLFAVSESNLHRDVVPLDIALRRFADQISARADDHNEGVPTGFASLDAKTGGLQPSDLILLAGRPGLGKTSFALNIMWNAAVTKKTCAIFSLEMSELQVVQRLVSMTSEIDGNRMRRGRLSDVEFRSISAASDELQKAPIYVEESSQLTVTDILAKSRRLQAEKGLDLVVVDYLQLIEGAGDDEGRVQEVARISRALKAIARELQVPVLAVSQLSRQIETRGTEPMLSDLRESGALEADADLVMFLWQKDRKDRDENVVRLKLAKHRNGPTGDFDLHFQSELTRFRDLGETRADA
jgi:replicative DNA helicase